MGMVSVDFMRTSALILALGCISACQKPGAIPSQNQAVQSRVDLPLEARLDLPQRVAGSSLRLKDFVSFIATSFKVPLLVEIPNPIPDIDMLDGLFSARQLLDSAIQQMPGYEWQDVAGVAHIYEKLLVRSQGNLMNVVIPRFAFPNDVGVFMWLFRPCVNSVIQGFDCGAGVYTGFQSPKLKQGRLPYMQVFSHETARNILLTALKENGKFYVLIAFESNNPKLKSKYPSANWFAESLEVDEPAPMWIQPVPRTS
jgi:hypothetical protein